MKKLLAAIALLTILFQMSCSPDPTIEDEQGSISKKLRASTWKPSAVMRDGVDVTSEYNAMRLSISVNSYSTTSGGLSWPAAGTWEFVTGSKTQILRDGAVVIDFELSNGNKTLTLDFEIDETVYEPGRAKSLAGSYHFVLVQ
jgi:hypothetical protein